MKTIQSASVCGLGKLGACIAATLAQRGFQVVGIDIDAEKVRLLNQGEAPVEEPRLQEVLQEGRSRLRATLDYREVLHTDATFFIPPTPSLPDGSFSTEFLLRAMQPVARAVGEAGKKGHIFVCSSTTTPGSVDKVIIPMLERETGWKCGVDFGVCYNPEFIALGDVVRGLLEPDMVLIGESDKKTGNAMEDLYRRYNRNKPHIARMSIASAEIAKISVNSFITMKISFTNQLRLIAERFPEANIHDILDAVGSDTRIGRKYLRAGLSFGGPCFPRDNRMLAFTAKQVGLVAPLAEASDRVNDMTKERLLDQVRGLLDKKDTVVVLGVSYKPDTYIVEEAAGLYLAQNLKRLGYRVLVHDFAARPANSSALHEFEMLDSLSSLVDRKGVRAVVVCCPWPGYRGLRLAPGVQLIDHWGVTSS
jgi:UDPglucose 6-dehydrogenase